MILAICFFLHSALSAEQHICVCNAIECSAVCRNGNSSFQFRFVEPSNFESFLHHLSSILRPSPMYYIHVANIAQSIAFNLSSITNLTISFDSYFQFTTIKSTERINVKMKIDQLKESHSRISFSNSNLFIQTDFNFNNLKLDYLSLDTNSIIQYQDDTKKCILHCKCAELSEYTYLQFDQIFIENGYCKNDIILNTQSIHELKFSLHSFDESEPEPVLFYNGNHSIIGASQVLIRSTQPQFLHIKGFSNNFSITNHLTLSLYCFNNISLTDCFPDSFCTINLYETDKIFCDCLYLPISVSNADLIVNSEYSSIFINGEIENITFISNNNSRVSVFISNYCNYLSISNSSIDILIENYKTYISNPFTFCIGKYGISTIVINQYSSETSQPMSYFELQRDFDSYLSDDDIQQYLYKKIAFITIDKIHIQNPISELIQARYATNIDIHGFCDRDSVLDIFYSESEENITVAAYLHSPNKKQLKLCLGPNLSNDGFVIENIYYLNKYIPEHVENVIIEITDNYSSNNLIFNLFRVNNLTIQSIGSGKIGSLTFNEKIADNITIANLHEFDLQFLNEVVLDNLTILNSSTKRQIVMKQVTIENLSTNTQMKFRSEISIHRFNFLVEYIRGDINFVEITNTEIMFTQFDYPINNIPNISIIFPYSYGQSTFIPNRRLEIFMSSDSTPQFDIHIIESDLTIVMTVDDQFDLLDHGKVPLYYKPRLTVLHSSSLHKIDFIGDAQINFTLNYPHKSLTNTFCIATDQSLCLPTQKFITKTELNDQLSSIKNNIVSLSLEGTLSDSIPSIQSSSLQNKHLTVSSINKKEKVCLIDDYQTTGHIFLSTIVFNNVDVATLAHGNSYVFGSVKMYGDSLFDSSLQLCFDSLEAPFHSLSLITNPIQIKKRISLNGEIPMTNTITKIQFLPKSMMTLNLTNTKAKIRFEANRRMFIEDYLLVDVEYIEINIYANNFEYIVENEDGNSDFPQLKLTQMIFVGNSEKEKVTSNPQPNNHKNSVTLVGDWASVNPDVLSFHCLNDVAIYVKDSKIPFHFFDTNGDITFYIHKSKTDFLGDIIFSNANTKVQLTFFYLQPVDSDSECIVNILGTIGGFTLINLYLLQNIIHINIANLEFKQPTIGEIKNGNAKLDQSRLLIPHLYIDINGNSQLSIKHNGYQIASLIYLYFYMESSLDDPQFETFLNTSEKVLFPYIDSVVYEKFTKGWDLFPITHGVSSIFDILPTKNNQICMRFTKSPSDITFELCINLNEECEVNLYTKEELNDMRSYLPKGRYPLLINIVEVDPDAIFNFNYDFFNNFSVAFIGNQRDIKISLGHNHVTEMEASYTGVVIVDDDYEIDTWYIGVSSTLTNVKGVKNLIYSFDSSIDKSFTYSGNLILKTTSHKLIFKENQIIIPDVTAIDTTKIPHLYLWLHDSTQEKVFQKEDNLTIVPQIGLSFLQNTSIRIGHGWNWISRNDLFSNISGVSHIQKIVTESFPLTSFHQLTSDKVKITPDPSLMPIKYQSDLLLNENEKIELDLKNSNDKITFQSNVTMANNSALLIYNVDHNVVQMQNLIIKANSTVYINSTQVIDSLEINDASTINGFVEFDEKSTIIINVNLDTFLDCHHDKHFPIFLFNSIPKNVPKTIYLNIENDIDDYWIIQNRISSSSCQILNDHFKIINTGLSCLYWLNSLKIHQSQSSFFFQPVCRNGFLCLTGYINNESTQDKSTTPDQALPSPNFSSLIHPSFAPHGDSSRPSEYATLVASLIVFIVFLIFIIILIPLICYLKKKYKEYVTNSLEAEINESDNL